MECIFNKYHLAASRSHHFRQLPSQQCQIELLCGWQTSIRPPLTPEGGPASLSGDSAASGDQVLPPGGGDMYLGITQCKIYILQNPLDLV